MAEITANLNWLAIIIGTVLSFLLGWFWYSTKLFGTKWASGNNIDLSSGDKKCRWLQCCCNWWQPFSWLG